MNKPINVGLVGCGYWGPNLVRNFKGLSECRLKVVCDRDEKRLAHMKQLFPDVEGVTDFQQMLADSQLNAVAIATSVNLHYSMAKASLLAGKHTFIEKPMASSSAECEELIELAHEGGLVLMVGHTFLYSSPVRKIKEIIDRGELGALQYVSCRRLSLGLFQKDINVVWDLAPHDLSIVLHVMDEMPFEVNCQGNANITNGIEDITNMSLRFPKNRFATVQNSWLDPRKVREMTFVGTKRMIVYDDVETHDKIKIYDARVERPPHYDTFAEFQYAYHYGDMYVPRIKMEEPLKVECQHFIDCIQHDRTPLTCGEKGKQLVRILEACSESLAQNGGSVALDGHIRNGHGKNGKVYGNGDGSFIRRNGREGKRLGIEV